MAENAAHLTTNLTNNPSIFEVVASDSLLATFYPAFKRIVNVRIRNCQCPCHIPLTPCDSSSSWSCEIRNDSSTYPGSTMRSI